MSVQDEVMARLEVYNELKRQILDNERTAIVDEFRDWLMVKTCEVYERENNDDQD